MGNSFTYYQMAPKTSMHKDFGEKDDIKESLSETQKKKSELGNKAEKQEAAERKADQVHQIWGDNFVSDSLH